MRRTTWLSGLVAVVLSSGLVPLGSAQGATDTRARVQPAASAPQPAPGTSGMDVWSYNITGAGTNENDPGDINNGGDPRAVTPVVNAINQGHRPDVIALQEVCWTQYAHLLPILRNAGYAVHWRRTKYQARCAAYRGYDKSVPIGHGDLIAVPAGYSPTAYDYDFDLATSAPVGEGMTCYGFTKGSFIVACSTHISGTLEQRKYKTFRMRRDQVEPWASFGYGIIVAGDINARPGSDVMKNLYHENGILYEADRTQNRWTHENRLPPNERRKIDYIFMSHNHFPRSSFVAALDTKELYSYHRFYAASSAMR